MTHEEREELRLAVYTVAFRANYIQTILTLPHITADLVSNINRSLQQIDDAMAIASDVMSSLPIPLATTPHQCQACGADLPPDRPPIWDEYGVMLCEACAMAPAHPESSP